ncbi:MAG: HAD-IA family hydrolase [Alphaproteobacteria bacterium]
MGVRSRLVIFDVDGTLVDSQDSIVAAMQAAFRAAGHKVPERAEALSVVGLSLPEAMSVLVPEVSPARNASLVDQYKAAYLDLRQSMGGEAAAPLYPGARAAVERLHGAGHVLGIATGKARRGLNHFLESHGLADLFSATQTADDAPSKPHPRMVLRCLADTGVDARDAVIVGDTEFDMAMGRAAGINCIGVDWGYHPADRVMRGGAEAIAADFDALEGLIHGIWEGR